MLFSLILVPELFRKVRETPGKNFHQVSSKSERSCTSYDQKIKFSRFVFLMFLMFFSVILVPELFRKMRETCGKQFHLVVSKSEISCPSYAQKAYSSYYYDYYYDFRVGFLVIARTGSLGFGRHLVEICPRSLPQLSKQLRDQNNSQNL